MGRALGWLLLLMACLIVLNIVARYVWNRYTIVSYELILYIHIWVIFLSLSYALQEKAHIGIDIVRAHLRARTQTWIDLLLTTLLALPPIVVIAWLGGEYALSSWKILENSPETGGLNFVYISKTAIPVGGALLFIQALVIITGCIKSLRRPNTDDNTDGGGVATSPCPAPDGSTNEPPKQPAGTTSPANTSANTSAFAGASASVSAPPATALSGASLDATNAIANDACPPTKWHGATSNSGAPSWGVRRSSARLGAIVVASDISLRAGVAGGRLR